MWAGARPAAFAFAFIVASGCSTSPGLTGGGGPAASAPSSAAALPTPTPPAPEATGPVVTNNVRFERWDPVMSGGIMDVYAPQTEGHWPVVVMFHGMGASKDDLRVHATRVAARGYVVFVPEWGYTTDPNVDLLSKVGLAASDAQNACALAVAEANAVWYGGDASTVIVFGHSAGAMTGAALAFAPGTPPAGCVATDMRAPDGLIAWEGDWLNEAGFWTELFTADPTMVDAVSIFPRLPARPDLRVALLQGATSDMPDLDVADLAVRDPTGALRKELAKLGALTDNVITIAERQSLLFSLLKAQGNPVTLDTMPGSTHEYVTGDGWPVFLAAFDAVAKP